MGMGEHFLGREGGGGRDRREGRETVRPHEHFSVVVGEPGNHPETGFMASDHS